MGEIGLFCGTFNPIHIGHLIMAECARDQFALDPVLFVTSPRPPHRSSGLLDAETRHELVVAAVADNHFFQASRLEIDRAGPSYTADTIEEIRSIYDGARVNLILGEDNLPYLTQWHRAEEIIRKCRLVVARRDFPSPNPKYESQRPAEAGMAGADLQYLDFPLVPISASTIRERLFARKSVRYMVSPAVHKLIEERGLYRQHYTRT